jgi:hypothetical protein
MCVVCCVLCVMCCVLCVVCCVLCFVYVNFCVVLAMTASSTVCITTESADNRGDRQKKVINCRSARAICMDLHAPGSSRRAAAERWPVALEMLSIESLFPLSMVLLYVQATISDAR